MPYCAMFEHGCVIGPSGSVRPCCHFVSDETYKYYDEGWLEYHKQLGEKMKSSDEFIPECFECKDCIDRNKPPFMDTYNEQYAGSEGIVHWDLKINNTCNLSCKMCDSWSSSTWDKIIKNNPDLPEGMKSMYGTTPPQKWHRNISEIFDYLYFCKRLKFTGGEPFLIPQVDKIINFVVDKEISKNITLEITTNGTQDMTNYVETFSKFHKVSLNISIDAIGKRFEYIRQGANWSEVESNILKIKELTKNIDVRININCTTQILNKDHVHEVEQWANKHKLYFNGKSRVWDPECFSPYALEDKDTKAELLEVLENLDNIHGTDYKEFLDA